MGTDAAAAGPASAADSPAQREKPPVLRTDIQGLRTIAVSLVVIFHLWPRSLTGGYVGVDAFFVISGFLITTHLFKAPPTNARGLTHFWARRIKRLLPASLFVLLCTLVASRLLAPELDWARTAKEVIASTWYVENWYLASTAVDYLGSDSSPSPVQHFWSLSVEEQFYLVWPVIILVLVWGARRLAKTPAALFLGGLSAIFAVSLTYSITLTISDPQRVYFVTPARAWEFAAGGIVGWLAVYGRGRMGDAPRNLLAWGGLAAVIWSGVAYSESTPFPGYAALVPVLGTAAVLGAAAQGRFSPARLWSLPGVQWAGGASYSIYLWHWPMIVIGASASGGHLSNAGKLVVLALTLVLAQFSKTLIEDRVRFSAAAKKLRLVYGGAAIGMVLLTCLGLLQIRETENLRKRDEAELIAAAKSPDACFGAAAAAKGPIECPEDPGARMVPAPALASDDRSEAYKDGCFVLTPFTDRATCTYGTGKTRVALVGNSHAGHWLPALQLLAERNGWTITTFLISVCNVSDAKTDMPTQAQTDQCADYTRWVWDKTKGSAFDFVITSERQSRRVPGKDWVETRAASQEGYESFLKRWAESGAKVVVLKDPVPPGEVGSLPECLAKNMENRSTCEWPYQPPVPADPTQYRYMDPLAEAAKALNSERVHLVSVDDLLCTTVCAPVIGRAVTYFDSSHLTATFARTLAPYLGERIAAAVPESARG